METIAFPCISTGVYGYPKAAACRIAIDTVVEWLNANEWPREIIFCCFAADDRELYEVQIGELK
jgi:O-acetyl-ADP-ribose deacetylase (regulator of RNase III)